MKKAAYIAISIVLLLFLGVFAYFRFWGTDGSTTNTNTTAATNTQATTNTEVTELKKMLVR